MRLKLKTLKFICWLVLRELKNGGFCPCFDGNVFVEIYGVGEKGAFKMGLGLNIETKKW